MEVIFKTENYHTIQLYHPQVYIQKNLSHKPKSQDTSTSVLTAVLVTRAKTQSWPRSPSTDEWIKYTIQFYPTVKKDEIKSFAEK